MITFKLPSDYYYATTLYDETGRITILVSWCQLLARQLNATYNSRTQTLNFQTEEDLVMFKLSTPYPNSNEQK